MLLIIVLATILHNGGGGGVCHSVTTTGFGGNTVDVDVLGCADDLCLAATNANAPSAQTTSLADESADFADVTVNVPKVGAMHAREDEHKCTGVTEDEAAAATSTHEHTCECCPGKASTTEMVLGARRRLWCAQAQEAAAVTETTHKIDKLVDCGGPPSNRWCCVSWQGKDTSSETIDGAAPGETWPDTWEVAAHVEGCTDDRGAAHTGTFLGPRQAQERRREHGHPGPV